MKRSLFRNIKVLNKLNISHMHKWDVVIKLSFFEKKKILLLSEISGDISFNFL